MAQAQPSSKFTNLPTDIHKLIISALDTPLPLFARSYVLARQGKHSCGDLKRKQAEYYGGRNEDNLGSAQRLVNWSATCHFSRELLAPTIFRDILLRPRATSMSSVKLLFSGTHRKHIRSLSVVSTYAYEQWPEDMDPRKIEMIDPLEAVNHNKLFSILASLPDTVECLTLDFPTDWMRGLDLENADHLSMFEDDELPEQTLEIEAKSVWRKLIHTVLAATANNDLFAKESFELRLLNIPPLPCSVYWLDEFFGFLKRVTSLTLAFDPFRQWRWVEHEYDE